MIEIWKPVPIKEFSFYEVSNFGKVRNGAKKLKMSCSRGYPSVILCNNGYRKSIRVHRLVAMAFIKNPFNFPCINHKMEIKKTIILTIWNGVHKNKICNTHGITN